MDYKDYYKVMGLARDASQEEIKRTYRKLARKYHPDVSKETDAKAKFQELGEAYEVLGDPEKRAKYDQFGQYWREQGQAGAAGGGGYTHYQQGPSGASRADFEDFLNSIFGGRHARQEESFHFDQGRDIHAKLSISLEDSFHGAEKTLQLQVPAIDRHGQVDYEMRAIKVKIPKGITDKQQIRLKGQGGKSGRHAGDLYIEINILPHPLFRLEKKDVYLQLPITPWEAALGATIQVPTLAGPVNLKVAKLSQSGKQMRLKGRGLPGHAPGDQYVILEIVIPTVENDKLDQLYQQMAETTHFNPREKLGVKHG